MKNRTSKLRRGQARFLQRILETAHFRRPLHRYEIAVVNGQHVIHRNRGYPPLIKKGRKA